VLVRRVSPPKQSILKSLGRHRSVCGDPDLYRSHGGIYDEESGPLASADNQERWDTYKIMIAVLNGGLDARNERRDCNGGVYRCLISSLGWS
jgi:hypothetical protein